MGMFRSEKKFLNKAYGIKISYFKLFEIIEVRRGREMDDSLNSN